MEAQQIKKQYEGKGKAEKFPSGKNKLDKEAGVGAKDAAQYKEVNDQRKQMG